MKLLGLQDISCQSGKKKLNLKGVNVVWGYCTYLVCEVLRRLVKRGQQKKMAIFHDDIIRHDSNLTKKFSGTASRPQRRRNVEHPPPHSTTFPRTGHWSWSDAACFWRQSQFERWHNEKDMLQDAIYTIPEVHRVTRVRLIQTLPQV